ncbi:MAG: BatA domain-containing protein [Saprospiraceae bacterium]|nr:BatA domain-containing protein [Saprospiraceae bacterium]
MQFSYPGILWALGLLAIPIIIHLFYFKRYKQVYFTNVRFLKELVEETSHKNKLKNLLILISRILALAALILAFAQPFFKDLKAGSAHHKAISIFVDNSWSMNSSSSDGSLFIRAKRSAFDIIQAYSDYDRFQIISHEMSGKQSHLFSKTEAFTALEEIQQTSTVNNLNKIIYKQVQSIKGLNGYDKEIFILSDFQKSIVDPLKDTLDSQISLNLLPFTGIKESNIAIDTAYFINAVVLKNHTNFLIYTLHNYGHEDVEDLKLSYSINGQEYPVQGVQIKAKKSLTDTIPIAVTKSGIQKIILKIADYPIQFDDQYYLSCSASDEIKILVIYDKKVPANLIQALNAIPYFKVENQNVGAINYSHFRDYRLILLADQITISTGLADELKKSLANGCNLFIFPAVDLKGGYPNLESAIRLPKLTEFESSKREVGSINYESGLFDDVFVTKKSNFSLPVVTSSYQISSSIYTEPLLKYKDGSAYVARYAFDNGLVYLSSASSNEEINSLSKNAEIFLPLLFKAAVTGKNTHVYSYTIGVDQIVQLPFNDELTLKDNIVRLKGPEEFICSARFVPGKINLEVIDQLKKAGIYDVYNQDEILGSIAFNDNRRESDMEFVSKDKLKDYYGNSCKVLDPDQIGSLTASLKESNNSKGLWWYLIFAGIVFLFIESILIRYWKNS